MIRTGYDEDKRLPAEFEAKVALEAIHHELMS